MSKILTTRYGSSTSAEDVAKDFATSAQGRTAIVTGANTGIGIETARCLAVVGATVVVTCRSQSKVDETVSKLKSLTGSKDIYGFVMELSSLKSVRSCAKAYIDSGHKLNYLINNAGVMACPRTLTEDGFESQFGVNHLGHFLFTNLLLPLIKAAAERGEPARIVNLSSMGHFLFLPSHGVIPFDDVQAKKYDRWRRYGESKLANIVHAKELTRRFQAEGSRAIAVSVHPGAIMDTDLKRHFDLGSVLLLLRHVLFSPRKLFLTLFPGYKKIPQGASTTLYAALCPEVVGGGYYADCRLETTNLNPVATDTELAARLWKVSEQLVAGF